MALRRVPPCPPGTVLYDGSMVLGLTQTASSGSVTLPDGAGCEESLPETTSVDSLKKKIKDVSEKCHTYITLRIVKFFIDKGHSVNQACAIAGNAMQETGNYQYAQSINVGTGGSSWSFGLYQCNNGGKFKDYQEFCKKNGLNWTTIDAQNQYVYNFIAEEKDKALSNGFRTSADGNNSLEDLTELFMKKFEVPDPRYTHLDVRIKCAKKALELYEQYKNTSVNNSASLAAGEYPASEKDKNWNFRSVGGWVTADGTKRMKHNIIYRGRDPQDNKGLDKRVLEKGVKAVLNLRGGKVGGGGDEGDRSTRPGWMADISSVEYANIPLTSSPVSKCIKQIRTWLTEGKAPIYVHCQEGRMRTSTVITELLSLINISTNDMLREDQLTNVYKNCSTVYYTKSGKRNGKAAPKPYSGNKLDTTLMSYLLVNNT